MSDSVRPHRRQPTRLLCPWDSPGKNTGVGCHFLLQCMKVKSQSEVAQSCLSPSDPMDCSLPGSSVHGIFQARVLEWGAIAFSRECILPIKKDWPGSFVCFHNPTFPVGHCDIQFSSVQSLSHVRLFATPWTAAHQAPPSMGFSRQEYWSALPFPSK